MADPLVINGDNETTITLADNNDRDILIRGDNEAVIRIGSNNRGRIIIEGDNEAEIWIGDGNRGAIQITGNNERAIHIGRRSQHSVDVRGVNTASISCGDQFRGIISTGDDNEGTIEIGSDAVVGIRVGDVNQGSIRVGSRCEFGVDITDDNEGTVRAGNQCRGVIAVRDANQGEIVVGHDGEVRVDVADDNDGTVRIGDRNRDYVRVGGDNDHELRVGQQNGGNVVVGSDNDGNLTIGDQNRGRIDVHGENDGSVRLGDQNAGMVTVHDDNEGTIAVGSQNDGLVHVRGDNDGEIVSGNNSRGSVVVAGDNDGRIEMGAGGEGGAIIGGDRGDTGTLPARDPAEVHARVQQALDRIKAAARSAAARDVELDANSRWFTGLLEGFYLRAYLENPSPEAGEAAIRLLSAQGEGSAFNQVPIPSILGSVLEGLPNELGAATGVLHPLILDGLTDNIDHGFLLGEAYVTNLQNDPISGGRNQTQLLHWATGIKFHAVPTDTMRTLFLGYEIWHLEGWESFGEDAINDLIAEEQGRLMARQLAAGELTRANLLERVASTALEARAWVGSLIAGRLAELDEVVTAEVEPPLSRWLQGGAFAVFPAERGLRYEPTLFELIANGASVDDVLATPLAQRYIDIYRLVYESERWQAANGTIVHPPLVRELLAGDYDALLESLAVPGFPGPGFIPAAFSAVRRPLSRD